jgi:hypothetical protein
MLSDYTYYRPAVPEGDLSTYFAERLELTRVEGDSPFPLKSDRWWVRTYDPDEDWESEAARIGVDVNDMVMVIFEPSKGLSAEEENRADHDLFSAIVEQLNETADLAGLLVFGEAEVLIERAPGGRTQLSPTLADPSEYNRDNHLAAVLAQGEIADLADL